jgi:cellulose 1,4-beta-cellobiosidase
MHMKGKGVNKRLKSGLSAAGGALLATAGLAAIAPTSATAAAGCTAAYSTTWDSGTGFGAQVVITNLGTAWTNWTLTYSYAGNQTLQSGWNGTWAQSGKNVTVTSLSWNGAVASGGTVTPAANFTYSGANPAPTSFAVNGVTCTGAVSTSPSTSPSSSASSSPSTSPSSSASSSPSSSPSTSPSSSPSTSQGGGGGHVANPYLGATQYLSPDYTAEVNAQAAADGGTLGATEAKMANYQTAVWMDHIGAITGDTVHHGLRYHLDQALAQKQGTTPIVFEVVVYDLPGRDCAALASNGEIPATAAGLTQYETQYVDPIAAILADPKYAGIRISAIIEPDSLPNVVTNQSKTSCSTATPYYEAGVSYALNKLHAISNVYNYVDIGHSGWMGWSSNLGPGAQEFAKVANLTTAKFASVDGFISNTANYTPTQEPFLPNSTLQVGGNPLDSAKFYQYNPMFDEYSYDNAMYSALVSDGFSPNIGMLIDTSRNGWGGSARPTALNSSPTTVDTYVAANKIDQRVFRGNWCNQNGAGIGARPAAQPYGASSHIIAFVWIKPPGESDGDYPTASHTHGDPHCDPASTNTDGNGGTYNTGSIPGYDVPAGQWFGAEFSQEVQNAYPAL